MRLKTLRHPNILKFTDGVEVLKLNAIIICGMFCWVATYFITHDH